MNRQIRGKLYLTPNKGDLWAFLNELVHHIETHESYFKMTWANAYVEPYRGEFYNGPSSVVNADNLLTLKVRGIGHADNAYLATDALVAIVASVAKDNGIQVNGAVEFTEWSVDPK